MSAGLRTDELTPGARVIASNMTRFTVDSVTLCVHDYRFHAEQPDGSYKTETGMEIVGHDDAGEFVAFTAGQSCLWCRDDTPAPVEPAEPEHRIPGCSGSWHDDDICDVVLADLATPGTALIAEVSVGATVPAELVVWEAEGVRNLLRTHDAADGHAFAEKLRSLAVAVDKGANLLAPTATSEPADHAARFAALDSDVLFALEDESGDMDAPQSYIESLLIVLAEWRPRVVAMLADAPEWAVPEAAQYRRALDRTREAWTQWSFRWEGGPELPYPFDLPEPVERVNLTRSNVARITSAGRRTLTVREVAA